MEVHLLEKFRVQKAPSIVFYIADFINEEEEAALLQHIYAAPKPKWKQLAHRRLQNWGGLPHPKGMIPEDLPGWLNRYVQKVWKLDVFDSKQPNHVLINEYLPGQGIMPHSDGPLFHPTISTLNLGSHTLLNFYKPPIEENDATFSLQDIQEQDDLRAKSLSLNERYHSSLLLMPRSLLVLKQDMYTHFHHGIIDTTTDRITDSILNLDMCPSIQLGQELERKTRVSLTIRHVPHIVKFKFGIK